MKKLHLVKTLIYSGFLLCIGCSIIFSPKTQFNSNNVISLPGCSKEMIYSKSLQWIAQTFKNAKAVLEYQNIDKGRILGSVSMKHDCVLGKQHYIYYALTIDIKNEKARITLEGRSMGEGIDIMELRNNYFCPGSLYDEMEKDYKFLQEEYSNYIKKSLNIDNDW